MKRRKPLDPARVSPDRAIGRGWWLWCLVSAACHGGVFLSLSSEEPTPEISMTTGRTVLEAQWVTLPSPSDPEQAPPPEAPPPVVDTAATNAPELPEPVPPDLSPELPEPREEPTKTPEEPPKAPTENPPVPDPPEETRRESETPDKRPMPAAQEASAGAEPQDDIPRAVVSPPPRYPRIAVQRGLEGSVRLGVHLTPDGRPRKIDVLQGSGYAFFDREAVETVRERWRFKMNGELQRSLEVVIDFRLQ